MHELSVRIFLPAATQTQTLSPNCEAQHGSGGTPAAAQLNQNSSATTSTPFAKHSTHLRIGRTSLISRDFVIAGYVILSHVALNWSSPVLSCCFDITPLESRLLQLHGDR